MFYSKSTKGFYTPDVHGTDIPADAVEITDDSYQSLMDGQSVGMVIVCNEIGELSLASAPPPPIATISPRQIRQALTRAGLRTRVESAVAGGSQDLKDWYEFSTAFERLNPQVIAMGEALIVSPASLDDLWALGATL